MTEWHSKYGSGNAPIDPRDDIQRLDDIQEAMLLRAERIIRSLRTNNTCDHSVAEESKMTMSDAELIEFSTEFRDGILGGRSSELMCAAISWPLAGLLRAACGIEAEAVEGDLGHCNHVWIKLPDGRVLDPTADQFNHFNDCKFPPVYLGPPAVIHPQS